MPPNQSPLSPRCRPGYENFLLEPTWKAGDRVLVRCQAGVNRSGLVTALILLLDGWQPDKIVEHLRARRSSRVLSNDDFRAVVCHGDELEDQNLRVCDVTV